MSSMMKRDQRNVINEWRRLAGWISGHGTGEWGRGDRGREKDEIGEQMRGYGQFWRGKTSWFETS